MKEILLQKAVEFLPILIRKIIFLTIVFKSYSPVKNFILRKFEVFFRKKTNDELLLNFINYFIVFFVQVFYFLNFISVFGLKGTSIIALLGSMGVAIGLALKGSLSDVASGIKLLFAKPFSKGDFISFGGYVGTIVNIGFFQTKIFSTDNKVIIIPNSKIANDVVTNITANSERRVDCVFSAAKELPTVTVIKAIKEVVDNHELILKERDIFIRLSKMAPSANEYTVRVWVKKENYVTVLFDLQELVKDKFDQLNIEIPYEKLVIYNK